MLDLLKNCCNCFLLSLEKFQKLIKFITQSYLSLLNSFLFLSRFYVSLKSLNNYLSRRFAYKSLLNRFSVLINYIMWFSNHCSTSSCLPRFSGSRFFLVQVFQSPGFSGSRFQKQPLLRTPLRDSKREISCVLSKFQQNLGIELFYFRLLQLSFMEMSPSVSKLNHFL